MKTLVMKKTTASALSLTLGVLLLLGAWLMGSHGDVAAMVSARTQAPPIYSVDRGEERVAAITINAGDGDEDTRAILDVLDRYGVKATFFFVGSWARRHPESLRDIAARGHELGNHSDTHPDMTQLSVQGMQTEIRALDDKIEEITGIRPTLFRAPSGAYNAQVVQTARDMGHEAVQWDVDSHDWKGYGAADIETRVLKGIKPGSIVLLHINSKGVVAALEAILARLTADGWHLIPVGALLLEGPYRLDATGKMFATQ